MAQPVDNNAARPLRCGNHLTTGTDGTPLTCLTVNEIRRMHAIFCRPDWPPEHHLHWSRWRHRHQAIARQCHYNGDTNKITN